MPKQPVVAKVVRPKTNPSSKPRTLPNPKRIWYNPLTWYQNLPAPPRNPLPKARVLAFRMFKLLLSEWKLFGGIILIYGLLNILLVKGLSSGADIASFKATLDAVLGGTFGQIQSVLGSFAYLIATSGGGATTASGTYQSVLLCIASLAFIWSLRQTTAKHKARVRDSFYKGMYPLIPFVLVLLVLSIQLLPLIGGIALYQWAMNNGVAVNSMQQLLFIVIAIATTLWSLRMFTATVFALYVVTLPDMTPLKALRSARKLVYKRRLLIWRKLIFLPITLLLAAAVIELPLIWFLAPLAVWVFFAFSMAAVAYIHAYLYGLYRELL